MWRVFLILCLPQTALAESLVATRNLPARHVITEADLTTVAETHPRALRDARDALGMETRIAIYAARPIRLEDLARPALVERNATVTLIYTIGGLSIRAEGRALARAAAGENLKVMNLQSKTTVQGRVRQDGLIQVGGLS